MARMTFKAGDEYALKLSKLTQRADGVAKMAIYDGAATVITEIKNSLRSVVSDEATGDLEDSLGITSMKQDADGWNAKIGFDGYDRKGVPNQLKARALESGTSRMRKRPFVRPAVRRAKPKAEAAMAKVIDEQFKKIIK